MMRCLPWGRQRLAVKTKRSVVSVGILVLSIILIGIGIINQEHLEVMQKAVKVCLECIGIG